MKPVLIIENSSNSLKINENAVTEKKYVMEGIFTEFGVKNRNERIYTAEEFVPYVVEMMDRKKWGGAVFGEFDHPDVFDISMKYVSHVIENCVYNQEANRIDGEIRLLNTTWGKEAKAIVDDGCPIFVSSRAAGVTEANGHVKLKKLFTYDIVADPGFSSAKMNLKSLNESFGFSNDTNFRIMDIPESKAHIFDLSNYSKTNELFNMNKNDIVTKKQMADYSKYLTSEISKIKNEINTQIKESADAKRILEMSEYLENLNEQFSNVVKYLDYLAEKVSVSISKGEELEVKTEKIVEYSNYIAEQLDKSIDYSNYIAEQLDKTIDYSNYIAEQLDKNIAYTEYVAENLDDSIKFSNYLAENLEKTITYAEYVAENLDANIGYTEYLVENLDANIGYTEYIAEHLESAINYAEYVAECADKTMSYANMIAEKLNGSVDGGLIKESIASAKDFLAKDNIPVAPEVPAAIEDDAPKAEAEITEEEETATAENATDSNENSEASETATEEETATTVTEEEESATENNDTPAETVVSEEEEAATAETSTEENTETSVEEITTESITSKIDRLIAEAKKREASKDEKPAFYAFLNSQDIETFESLTQDDQEKAKVAIKESVGYYSRHDVLNIVKQAIEKEKPTTEQLLINAIPEDIKPIWESLDQKEKKSVLAQAKYYDLSTNELVEHFWTTRKFQKSLNESKKLIESNNPFITNEKLSEDQIDFFTNKFKGLI